VEGVAGRLKPAADAAGAAPADRAAIEKSVQAFVASQALEAARLTSVAWHAGQHDAGLLRLAAQAQLALCLQSYDTLGIADALPARVLALLAMHTAVGGPELTREHALLAGVLGYAREARELAKNLPADDPARAFIEGNEASLRHAAQLPNAAAETRYFLLHHLAHKGQIVAALEFQAKYFPSLGSELPWFGALLASRYFATTEMTASALPYATLVLLESNAPDKDLLPAIIVGGSTPEEEAALKLAVDALRDRHHISGEALIAPFEKALDARAAEQSGPLFGADMLRAFYRGYFYSGLDRLGRHYLDSLSWLDATVAFAMSLDTASSGPGAEFKRWYIDIAKVKVGASGNEPLLADLEGLKQLGSAALERSSMRLRKANRRAAHD